jgi:eukaryotic-like serine/threonine-protein kinase
MNDDSSVSADSLFLQAIELDSEEARRSFLADSCGQNPALMTEVQSLIESHFQSEGFLECALPDLLNADPDVTVVNSSGRAPNDTSRVNLNDTECFQPKTTFVPAFLSPSETAGSLGRLGSYEVLSVIGQGGMGAVLRARDERLQRTVAIKVLLPHLVSDSGFRERFLREARAAAAIRSPWVVTIHAVEAEHEPPYLVLEHVEGGTLADLFAGDQRLPVIRGCRWLMSCGWRLMWLRGWRQHIVGASFIGTSSLRTC